MFISGSRCINQGTFLVLYVVFLFSSVNVFADTLKVANGSTLTGILKRITTKQVHLDTGFAGILKIDQNQVLTLRTDEPVYFRMNDGSTVLGLASAGPESGQLAIRSRNGPIGAQITDIVDAWRRGQEDPAVTEMKNEQEKKLIQDYIKLLENNKVFDKKIVTQILPFEVFYYAEEYHQNYERLNPKDPYVINVSIPRINRFKKLYPELLKESFNN